MKKCVASGCFAVWLKAKATTPEGVYSFQIALFYLTWSNLPASVM